MNQPADRRSNRADGAPARALSRLLLILAAALLPGLAASQPGTGALKGNPRLSSLSIQIWPEYDRPAALVILNGELPVGAALPAVVSLRLSAATGGPHAVAASTGAGATPFNVPYERKNADDFITLRFETPQRFFHVEFYEPLATGKPERNFTYVWPGDLAADRVTLVLQQPAAATGLSALPVLDAASAGQDGLTYRSAELGALEAGTPLPITVSYTKADARTSADILRTKAPDPSGAQSPGPPPSSAASTGFPGWVPAIAGAAVLAILAGGSIFWWRRRNKISAAPAGGVRYCTKCGAKPSAGDGFCAKCGARLA
ncbi:MAG: zinc ribbon domain-containing protein [Betaproteobacteria bacterium]|nr:zinc ribbon domain-containing protein [Betaproteobacteria bacterium]